jgi:hypothetical protein
MAKSMSPEQALQIAEHQRRRFNELMDVFDTPQPAEVMARLQEIVSAAGLTSGEIVLDVGTGAGVLVPLIAALRVGGRLVVSHPEGRVFVDQLRDASDLFLESLPTRGEFETILGPLGLNVTGYRDEPKLYLMVAEKTQLPVR